MSSIFCITCLFPGDAAVWGLYFGNRWGLVSVHFVFWLGSEAFGLGEVQGIYLVKCECPHVPTKSGVVTNEAARGLSRSRGLPFSARERHFNG